MKANSRIRAVLSTYSRPMNEPIAAKLQTPSTSGCLRTKEGTMLTNRSVGAVTKDMIPNTEPASETDMAISSLAKVGQKTWKAVRSNMAPPMPNPIIHS